MKLTHSVDLEGIRIATVAVLNAKFTHMAASLFSAVPVLHAAKLAVAQKIVAGEIDTHKHLVDEALHLDVSVKALAGMIVDKADFAERGLMAIEAERQAIIRKIEAATSEQEIKACLT